MSSDAYNRLWMYDRTFPGRGGLKESFIQGVDEFIQFACQHSIFINEGKVRCPCSKCLSRKLLPPDTVKLHLYKKGFKPDYLIWTENGEVQSHVGASSSNVNVMFDDDSDRNRYEEMVFDAFGVPTNHNFDGDNSVNDVPVGDCKRFFELLEAVKQPMFEGCPHSELSLAARLLSIKSGSNIPQHSMDEIICLLGELSVDDSRIPTDYTAAHKLVSKLGLTSQKIDCCPNGCMLFFKEHISDVHCQFCGSARYKESSRSGNLIALKSMFYFPIISRLQRLFASECLASMMRWHAEHKKTDGVMTHPSDGAAWKNFDHIYSTFAEEIRNVRLGLCADGFSPFSHSGRTYSSWPVIVTPYNLPPDMCMTAPYMFLTCLIPGPYSPKSKIDVFLQPLIDDLLILWDRGVTTYDVSCRRNFNLRAALMWTINDFPAYGMLSGWQTAGRLACPICMDKTNAFTLRYGGKQSWFDCHRQFLHMDHPFRRSRTKFRRGKVELASPPPRLSSEQVLDIVRDIPKITDEPSLRVPGYGVHHKWTKRSIFWDLPYWKDNLLRHNLDVIHIEKNFFDNICNTVMDINGKTKDNEKSRRDLEEICRRPELHLVDSGNGTTFYKPKAIYTLTKEHKAQLCDWLTNLKFPDGYASNLARCVDRAEGKLNGLKSHDCHILMQRLLPVMFKSLPNVVWEALSDLSTFFRDMCSSSLTLDDVYRLDRNIAGIICALETIFPPGFFDVMEHLPIHLVYEAWAGGPVQYRWMYPFERYLGILKRSITQKAKVEGSIKQAYLSRETSHFVSYYFNNSITSFSRVTRSRNDDGGMDSNMAATLSVFNLPGRSSGAMIMRNLTEQELQTAHLHILINCTEVQPFIRLFQNVNGIGNDLDHYLMHQTFPHWFREHVLQPCNGVSCPHLRYLSFGPLRHARCFNKYFVNGYKFHTRTWASKRRTNNSGVSVKGETGEGVKDDYYGYIDEILELEYAGEPLKRVVLFSCTWFDPTLGRGRRHNERTNITEVKIRSKYNRYDPFIIANRATLCFYVNYPFSRRDIQDWSVAITLRPIARVIVEDELEVALQDEISNVQEITDCEMVQPLADTTEPPDAVWIDGNETFYDNEIDADHLVDDDINSDEDADSYNSDDS